MLVCSTSPWLVHKEPVSLIVQSNGSVIRVVNSRTNRLIVTGDLPQDIRLLAFATGEFAIVGLGDVPQIVHCNARELIGISAFLLACTHEDPSALHIMRKSQSTSASGNITEDTFSGSVYFARNAETEVKNPYYLESNRIQSLLDFFHKHAKDIHEEVLVVVLQQQGGLNSVCLRLAQCGLYATGSYLCHVWSGYMFASAAGNLDFKHLIAHPERELSQFGSSYANVSLADSTANAILLSRQQHSGGGGGNQLACSCLQTRSIATVSHQGNVCRIFTLLANELKLWFSFYVKPQNRVLSVALSCYKESTAFEVELTRRRERCIVEHSMSRGDLVFITPHGTKDQIGKLGRVLTKTTSKMCLIQLGSAPLSQDDDGEATALPRNTCYADDDADSSSTNLLPVYYPCSRVLPVTEKRELEHDYFFTTVILVTELGASVYERHWEAEAWRPRLITLWETPNLKHVWFYSSTSCLLTTSNGDVYLWKNVTELGAPPTEVWQTFPSKHGGLTFSRGNNMFVLCDEHYLRVYSSDNLALLLEWECLNKKVVATAFEEDLRIRVLFADGTMELISVNRKEEEQKPEASFENILAAVTWNPVWFAGRSIGTSKEWFESSADGELKDLHGGQWEFEPTVTCEAERYAVFGEVEIGLLPESAAVVVGIEENAMEISKTTRFVLTRPIDKVCLNLSSAVAYVRLGGRTASRDEQALRATYASEEFQHVLWTAVVSTGEEKTPVAALVLLRAKFDKSKLTREMLIDFIQHQFVCVAHCHSAAVEFLQSLPVDMHSLLLDAALHTLQTQMFHTRQGLDALLTACHACFVNAGREPERFIDMLLRAGQVLATKQTWKTRMLSQVFACQFDPFANKLPGTAQAAIMAANDMEKEVDLCSTATKKRPTIRVHSFSNGSSTMFHKEAAADTGAGFMEICFQDVLKTSTTHGVVWDLSHRYKLSSVDLSITLVGEEDWSASQAEHRFTCTVKAFEKPPATWTGEKMAYVAHDELGLPFDIDMFAVSGSFSFDRDGIIGMKSTFPTIAPRAVAMLSGKHYYEVTVYNVRDGVAQIGFCDSQHQVDDRGSTGCGDCLHSWAFDGNRLKKWNQACITWGRRWSDGDVVGCAIDMDENKVYFSLNGSWKRPMGLAFNDIKVSGGVFPAVTGERGFKCKMNFGQTPFAHSPPPTVQKPFKPVVDWIVANRQRQPVAVAQGAEAPTLWVRETFQGANATITSSTLCTARYLSITFASLPLLGSHTNEANHLRKRVTAKINVRLIGKQAPPAMLILTEEDAGRFRTVLQNATTELDFALDQFATYNLSLPLAMRWTTEDTAQIRKSILQNHDLSSVQLPQKYAFRIVKSLALIESTQRDMTACTAERNVQADDDMRCDQWRVIACFICTVLPLCGGNSNNNNTSVGVELATIAALFEQFYINQVAFNRDAAGRMIQSLICNSSNALKLLVHLAKAKIGTDEDLLQIILPVPLPAMQICEQVVPELISSRNLVPLCCKLFTAMSQQPLPCMDTAQCVNQLLDLMSGASDDVTYEFQCLQHLFQVSSSPQTFLKDLCIDPRFIVVFQRIAKRPGFGMEKIKTLELLDGDSGDVLPPSAHDGVDISLELELALMFSQQIPANLVIALAARVFVPAQHVTVQMVRNWALMFRLLAQMPQQPQEMDKFAVFALTACLGVTDGLLSAVFTQDLLVWLNKLGPTKSVLDLLSNKSLTGRVNDTLCCKVLDLYLDCDTGGIDYNDLVVGWIHEVANALLQNNRTAGSLHVLASTLALCVHLVSLRIELVDKLRPATFDALLAWLCSSSKGGDDVGVRRITAILFRLFSLAANSTHMISSLTKALVMGTVGKNDVLFLLAKRLVALQTEDAARMTCNYLASLLANTPHAAAAAATGKETALKFDFMQECTLPLVVTASPPSKTLFIKLSAPAVLSRLQLDFTGDSPVTVSVEAGVSDTVLVACCAPQICSKTAAFQVAPMTCKFVKLKLAAAAAATATVESQVDWFVCGDKVKLRTGAESMTGSVVSFDGELVAVKWLNGERNTHEKSTLALFVSNPTTADSTALTSLHLFGRTVVEDIPIASSSDKLADLLLVYCNKHAANVLFSSRADHNGLFIDVLAQVKQQVMFPISTSNKRMLAVHLVKSNAELNGEVIDYCLERFNYPQCLALAVNLALDGEDVAASSKYIAKVRIELDSLLHNELPPALSLLWLIRGCTLLVEHAPQQVAITTVEDFSLAWLALDRALAESALELTLGQLVCTMARSSSAVQEHTKQQLPLDFSQRKFAILATSCNAMLEYMLPAIDSYCQQSFPSQCLLDKLVLIARERTTVFSTWFRESGWFARTLAELPVQNNAALKRKMLHLIALCCNQNSSNQKLVAESLAATCDVDLLALCTKFENYVQICAWDVAHEIDLLANEKPSPDRGDAGEADLSQPLSFQQHGVSWFRLNPASCGKTIELSNGGLVATQISYDKWGAVRADRELPLVGQSIWEIRLDQSPKGHVFVGVATDRSNLDGYLGCDRHSYGYIGNRGLWHNKHKETTYGKEFKTGDVIKVVADMNEGTISYVLNGENLGIAFTGLAGLKLYPAFSMYQKGDKLTVLYSTHVPTAATAAGESIAPADSSTLLLHRRPLQDASLAAWRSDHGVAVERCYSHACAKMFWVASNHVLVSSALHCIGRGCLLDALFRATQAEETNRLVASNAGWEIELTCHKPENPTATLSQHVQANALDLIVCKVNIVGL